MLDNASDHHASDDLAYNLLDDDCALLGKLLDDCLLVEVRATQRRAFRASLLGGWRAAVFFPSTSVRPRSLARQLAVVRGGLRAAPARTARARARSLALDGSGLS